MLGNMVDATLVDSSKYDSKLHHISVQMRQSTLPFHWEKQHLTTRHSEDHNAKADLPKKLVELDAHHCMPITVIEVITETMMLELMRLFWTVELEIIVNEHGDFFTTQLESQKIVLWVSTARSPMKKLRREFLKRLWRQWLWNYWSCK